MTTHNFSRTFLSLITLLLLFHFLYSEDNLLDVEVVDKVKSSILSADGHSFKVVWTYEYDGDIWTGEGSMKVLGQDYLKLNLDYQQILIKHDTLFTRYEETNQVVADWFDRTDPANFFLSFWERCPVLH